MTRLIPTVDPELLLHFMLHEGDVISRMKRVAAEMLASGHHPEAAEPIMVRMQSLFELLISSPSLRARYSDEAIIRNAATSKLVEPPMNLIGGGAIQFDEVAFERELAAIN